MKMGRFYSNGEEVIQNEKATPLVSNSDEGLKEEDQSTVDASGFKAESNSIISKLPLILDINQQNINKKCIVKLTATNCISFLGPDKNLSQHSINLVDDIAFDLFCRTVSLFNIPMDLYPTEFFAEKLKSHARTRTTSSLGDFVLQCGPGNHIIRTLGRSIFGSVEGTVNARTLQKSSFFLQLATVDSTKKRINARKPSKLANSPFGHRTTSFQEHKTKAASTENQSSGLKVSGITRVSCSSTNSTCSYQSPPFLDSSVSKGQIHCMWKSGAPYFVFKMGDDCSEVYTANPIRVESYAEKAMDYMYLFRSSIRSKKDFRNYGNNASDFVGKMKVSSSLTLDSNRSKVMETEFVLFGADRDHYKEMQPLMKNKGLSKKLAHIFRPSDSFKHKSKGIIEESSSRIEELSDFNEPGLVSDLGNDFPSNLELTAIVIKDRQRDSSEAAAVGGWGLKFLEKVTGDHADTSQESSCSSRSMYVLVPAGIHGGATTRTGCPSNLTERWRSGGHCDCGGWDIGCPLTVLSNSIVSEDFPQEESQEDCKSVDLFIEGAKHDEPTLKMVNTNIEGVYSLYFQSTLSALQSFSIGVAIIHAQMPALHPKL